MLNNEYENINKFYEFLEENAKGFDLEYEKISNTWLKDLEKRIGETGMAEYELSKTESITGRPEIITFEVTDIFYDDDNTIIDETIENWQDKINYSETKIIF